MTLVPGLSLLYSVSKNILQTNITGVHISFWFMLMTLIYWAEAYTVYKKNIETLVVASKEVGLEVSADKTTKYMVMS